MSTLQHRNVAHRMLAARQAGGGAGVGDGAGGGGAGGVSDPPVSPTPPPTSPSPPPPPPTSTSASSQTTPVKPTSKPSPPATSNTTKSSTSAAADSSSKSSSSSSASSSSSNTSVTSSSSVSSTSVVLKTNKAIAGASTQPLLGPSSFANVTPTDVNSAGSTVSADPLETTGATGMSTGSIVGVVAGTLIGLAIIGFISMILLRRFKRNRRYANRHESDFGTFNRSAFIKEKEPSIVPDMAERGHTVAPSLSNDQVAGVATPPSQALAAANAAAAASAAPAAPLQERPKYVYGQNPNPGHDTGSEDDMNDLAGGVYSSDPQAQMAYNPEAYGSYARYDDAGVAVGGEYQDAQREYQGQQGYYDQNGQQVYYDQNGQQVYYDQQGYAEGQYDYSQQHQEYVQEQPEQSGYQAPHPYANGSASGKAPY